MITASLLIKICVAGAAIGAAAIVAGKVARKVKSKSENQNSADFTTAHVETLYIKDVLSFFDNIEQNVYTGLVVYISPQDSNNSIVNHCRKEFQKKFGKLLYYSTYFFCCKKILLCDIIKEKQSTFP